MGFFYFLFSLFQLVVILDAVVESGWMHILMVIFSLCHLYLNFQLLRGSVFKLRGGIILSWMANLLLSNEVYLD